MPGGALPEHKRKALLVCLNAGLPSPADVVLSPSSPRWAEASEPYNLRLAPLLEPLALVYPSSPAAISSALVCARAANGAVGVQARSGGHSYGGFALGGADLSSSTLTLDLRRFADIEFAVGPDGTPDGTVKVGSGVMLGELAHALEKKGRAMPHGACPTVGVGGQALAGGFGLASRRWGLLLDSLVEVEAVLASGEHVIASEWSHPDLFWALRGAGPSYAIVHTFTFRTQPLPPSQVYFELVLGRLPSPAVSPSSVPSAVALFQSFQEFGVDMPGDLGMSFHLTPEREGIKTEILGMWNGERAQFETALAPLQQLAESKGLDCHLAVRELTYLESLHNVGGDWGALDRRGPYVNPEHVSFFARSLVTYEPYTEAELVNFFNHTLALHDAPPSDVASRLDWFVLAPFLGGHQSAIAKVAKDATAFNHRSSMITWEFYAKHRPEDEHLPFPAKGMDLIKDMAGALDPNPRGVYPAYVDPELSKTDHHRLLYGDHYPRLQQIKAQYDPTNLFRSPQSVLALSPPTRGFLGWAFVKMLAVLLLLFLVNRLRLLLRRWQASRRPEGLPTMSRRKNGRLD